MAASSKATAMHRRGLLGLTLLSVVLTIGVGALLWQVVELSSVAAVSAQIDQIKPIASGIRLALICLLAAIWPSMVRLAHRSGRANDSQRDNLLALRWRLVGWLLVIELVLGQNLFGQIFAETTGPIV
jgi:hypothetical protein